MLRYVDLQINEVVAIRIWLGHETRTKIADIYNRRGLSHQGKWVPFATIFYNNPSDPNGPGIRVIPDDQTKCSYSHTLTTYDADTDKIINVDKYLLNMKLVIRKAIKTAYCSGDASVLHGVSEELTRGVNYENV